MKKILLLLILAFQIIIAASQNKTAPKNYTNIHISQHIDSLILSFIPEISADSLLADIQALQDFGTRYALAPNKKDIALWIQNKYLSFGITDVVLDSFLLNGSYQYNVIATIPGSVNPNKVHLIGGHSDSYTGLNPMIFAPGADDNASGTVAAIEIARILMKKNYQPETTIKFAAFAAEELGLIGSGVYADRVKNAGMDIGLMINNDMIAYVSDTATTWKIKLCKYTGSEWACDLARDISDIYTPLVPFVSPNVNSGGSDSYSFWNKGYHVIYFFEPISTPYYHSDFDVVANCNMNFCAEVVRANTGLLITASESPDLVKNILLSDMGNGTALFIHWNSNKENDLAGYRVYIGNASNNYSVLYNTIDTSMIISGLTPGINYYIGVSAIDNKGNESVSMEKSAIPAIIPKVPVGLKVFPMNRKIKVSWIKNTENDLLGYNIYRSLTSGQNFEKINNTPIRDSLYLDSLININEYYYYKITAIDSLLNESDTTAEVMGKAASFDRGILIVDDSEGGLLNPTDEEVDNYYNRLVSGFKHANFDAYQSRTITIDTMGKYSSILWHIENVTGSTPVFYIKINEVKKYLDAGGKMILTFDRPSRVVNHESNYPLNLSPGSVMYDYLKIKRVELTNTARFIGAIPIVPGYDSIYIDSSKTPPDFNHHIINVEAIYADTTVASNIYEYDTQYDPVTPEGLMKNKPVGVEYLGNDYKIITLSFPLYYMDSIQSKRIVQYILQEKFHEYSGIKEKKTEIDIDFYISPNPVKSQSTISYNLPETEIINVCIYDIRGLLIKTLINSKQSKGMHQLYLNVSDLSNGIYFCKMICGNESITKKVIVVK